MDKKTFKYCKGCATNKNRINDFHHSVTGYCTTYCKGCSKEQRKRYITNGNYIKRDKGLFKLSPEIQQRIKDMRDLNATIKDISNVSGVLPITLYLWRRKGII